MMTSYTNPVTLEGQSVRLEPVSLAHLPSLAVVSTEPEIWSFMGTGSLGDPAALSAYITGVMQEPARGEGLVWAIIDRATDAAIGMTSFMDVSLKHKRLEVGRTWLGKPYWRTAINTECKRLVLGYAFETLGVNRVQIKTDSRNERSRRAIERIGAKFEGILRAHMVMWDGYVRDTAMYSVTTAEWPDVRTHLDNLIVRYQAVE